jgi:uncharacterized membrane protein
MTPNNYRTLRQNTGNAGCQFRLLTIMGIVIDPTSNNLEKIVRSKSGLTFPEIVNKFQWEVVVVVVDI